jgi:hypothetical protein
MRFHPDRNRHDPAGLPLSTEGLEIEPDRPSSVPPWHAELEDGPLTSHTWVGDPIASTTIKIGIRVRSELVTRRHPA